MSMVERRRPGARGRIGVIQPAPGVMLEHEWPRWLPEDVLFPVGRVRLAGTTAAAYAEVAALAPEAARDLATAGADLIAYACTIGSLFDGIGAERSLRAALEAASGKPAISLADTCVRALRAVGATRLAIMTPYAPETNAWVQRYIEARGFGVAGFVATPVSIATVGDMPPDEIAALAEAGLRALPDADALWIPCAAIQTMAMIEAAEATTALPVCRRRLLRGASGPRGADRHRRRGGRRDGRAGEPKREGENAEGGRPRLPRRHLRTPEGGRVGPEMDGIPAVRLHGARRRWHGREG